MCSKKILFVTPSFNNGGTMSSLRNLVPNLAEEGFELDVFAITNAGPNREYISKYCNVLGISLDEEKKKSLKTELRASLFRFVKAIKKLLCFIGVDISKYAFGKVVKELQKNNYDVVISFQEGQPAVFASLFENVKKVAWVRSDYRSAMRIGHTKTPQHELYGNFDRIVCVSQYTRNVFVECMPELACKTIALHNLINDNLIIEKSNDSKFLDDAFRYDGFRIVSVGRMDPVKRFSFIPEIAEKLKQSGCLFKWYIIGGGNVDGEFERLKSEIVSRHVENVVFLLGEKNNPYPYVKHADLLVCTSLSEACPNVINEAKILHTPIVSTNFGSASEFIDDGVNGLLAPIEQLDERIEALISDREQYQKIKTNLSDFHYENDEIVEVIKNEILK